MGQLIDQRMDLGTCMQFKRSFLHTLFLENETQIGEKKIPDDVFQWNCSSHPKIWTNPSKIEKRAKIRHRSVMLSALQLQY